ncbi:MAG: DnaD domain protein [Bacilli bacterium]|nr:DnaD domain protein [Bacilli bacterium]
MINEALDFTYLLLENYKKLKINENEVATILMVEHLIEDENSFVNADLLSLKMSLPVAEIDKILSMLLTKGYIEYLTKGKKTVTTLNPLKEKLFSEFTYTATKERETNKSEKATSQIKKVNSTFEVLLERGLSPIELSKIREWIEAGYNDVTIINALKEALSKGKRSLRSVDKILVAWSQRDDLETEGHTSIDESWDKNLEETIRIAKTPWINGNEDK